ncbi:TetR/AcrR family transcriptional regulator [Actinomyces respiraculi]|uniref:TetR/AcrR family transcriptional regulator n=1 Tax=Actinomyces respiraculi TaxID=2744574 RepID=UPI001423FEAD|nr:TetR/AcrR family transcriptional regulator [Actinomyces respiraculi]
MRADAAVNREAIIGAAIELLADVGLSVSTRQVAAAAGVGIGTLYRHFPTRTDLLHGVGTCLRERVDALAARFDERATEDIEAAWLAFGHEFVGLRLGRLIAQAAAFPDFFLDDAAVVERRAEAAGAIAARLDVAKRAGLVREDVDALHFALGASQISRPLGAAVDGLVPGWNEWLVDVYLRGLRP